MPDENDFEGSAVNFDAFPLTDIDRQILSMRDEDYHLTQWDELTEIICEAYDTTSISLPYMP